MARLFSNASVKSICNTVSINTFTEIYCNRTRIWTSSLLITIKRKPSVLYYSNSKVSLYSEALKVFQNRDLLISVALSETPGVCTFASTTFWFLCFTVLCGVPLPWQRYTHSWTRVCDTLDTYNSHVHTGHPILLGLFTDINHVGCQNRRTLSWTMACRTYSLSLDKQTQTESYQKIPKENPADTHPNLLSSNHTKKN